MGFDVPLEWRLERGAAAKQLQEDQALADKRVLPKVSLASTPLSASARVGVGVVAIEQWMRGHLSQLRQAKDPCTWPKRPPPPQ